MTVNIGLVYDKGVILLADGQSSAGYKIGNENSCKIFKIWDNVSIAHTGLASNSNLIEHMISAAHIANAYFEKFSREYVKKEIDKLERIRYNEIKKNIRDEKKDKIDSLERKIKFMGEVLKRKTVRLKIRDIEITSKTKNNNIKDVTLNKMIKNWDEQNIIPENIFRIYGRYGQSLFDIKSIARQYTNFVKMGLTEIIASHGLIAGIDIHGPKIINMNHGWLKEEQVASNGIGEYSAEPILLEYYQKNMPFNNALQLAIYSALVSSRDYIGINDNFMAVNISTKTNHQVYSESIDKNLIEKITETYKKRKRGFKFLDT